MLYLDSDQAKALVTIQSMARDLSTEAASLLGDLRTLANLL